jgi:hypothetical protein
MCAQLYESNQPSKHYNKIRAAAAQYSRIMPVKHVHPLVRTQKQPDRVLHEIEELVTSSCLRALRSAPPAKTRPVSAVHRPPPQAARLPSPPPLFFRSLSVGDASRRLVLLRQLGKMQPFPANLRLHQLDLSFPNGSTASRRRNSP